MLIFALKHDTRPSLCSSMSPLTMSTSLIIPHLTTSSYVFICRNTRQHNVNNKHQHERQWQLLFTPIQFWMEKTVLEKQLDCKISKIKFEQLHCNKVWLQWNLLLSEQIKSAKYWCLPSLCYYWTRVNRLVKYCYLDNRCQNKERFMWSRHIKFIEM